MKTVLLLVGNLFFTYTVSIQYTLTTWHGQMVIVHCCIIVHQVNTLSSRLNLDYSCTSKYFLTNLIEKTTRKIIIKMLVILDFRLYDGSDLKTYLLMRQ